MNGPVRIMVEHAEKEIGRQQVEEAFGDKVETSYVESFYGPDAEHMSFVK